MQVQVRQIRANDVPLMRTMLAMFGEAFEDPQAYGGAPPSDEYLRTLLARDHFIALAACEGYTLVGGIAAYVLDKFEQERSEVYIYDLAVTETHRRRGVATAMIRALQGIAAERGAHVIFVQADQGDDPAIAFYASLGVRADVLHFDIEVALEQSATNHR